MLALLSRRPVRYAAPAVILSAVAAGVVAYTHQDKNVTLSIDGKTQQVSADVSTVGDLLKNQGVTVTSRDLVSPDLTGELADGENVLVRFARPLTVTVDGTQRTYWTTALTVDSALASLGIRADNAVLSASRSEPLGRQGLSLDVSTVKPIRLVVGGKASIVQSAAPTVSALLAQQHVTVRPQDKVNVALNVVPRRAMTVQVVRMDTSRQLVDRTIAAPVRQVSNPALLKGRTSVSASGSSGAQVQVWQVVKQDGKVVSRKLVGGWTTRMPVARVVTVGTKVPPAAPKPARTSSSSSSSSFSGGSVAGASGLNWAALARCESGGNPRAVNPNGHYGLYQFSLSTWASVGGSGNPINASASEQTYRAQILYSRAGSGQWSCGSHLFD